MLSIGITGGMGSGKTLVCQIFSRLNIPIYNSDNHAKRLMEENESLKNEIKNLLGNESYNEKGKINRRYIAQKVFNNLTLLSGLNAIVHPAVKRDANLWRNNLPETLPYFIRESAILFETGIYKELDFNILVSAPEEIRIERVRERDGLTHDEIKSRINQQWPESKKQTLADFIITNDNKTLLIPQILSIHQKLIHYASAQTGMRLNINP